MSLRNVNLNLLPILRSLLKTQSVSRSAVALHLSQPTVSDALSRLRVLLDDELLVRIGGSMKLTQRATDLLEPLDAICTDLERLLHSSHFDPAKEVRELVVATSDICAYLLVRRFLEFLRMRAPGMTLHVVDIDSNLRNKMAAREVDFALLPDFAVDHLAPAPLRFLRMDESISVMMMWAGHPLAGQEKVNSQDLHPYSIIAFHPDAVIIEEKHFAPAWRDLDLKIEVRIGQMMLIPHLLAGSTSIAFVNEAIARDMAKAYPLVIRPLPFPEAPARIGLVWSPVFDGDPVHKWIRESLTAPPSP